MADLPFLESYTGQSTDELIALEGSFRVDSIVLAFEESLMAKDSLNHEERVVVAVEALEREVNNGGYSQFFVNSSRRYTPFIAEALRAIGCPKTAVLCEEAMAVLGITSQHSSAEIEDLASSTSEEQDKRLSQIDGA